MRRQNIGCSENKTNRYDLYGNNSEYPKTRIRKKIHDEKGGRHCRTLPRGLGIMDNHLPFADYKSSETTDDAQVEQYLSPVNIRVSGYIRKIYFTEHQHVCKGDTLVVLEDDEYRIRLKQAEAALMDARSGRKVAANTLNTASSSASAYDASIAEAQYRVAQLEKITRDTVLCWRKTPRPPSR